MYKKIIFIMFTIAIFVLCDVPIVFGYGYKIIDNMVYFENKVLKDVDIYSFSFNKNTAKDRNNVYIGFNKIQDLDPASFVVINRYYYKDKNGIYYHDISNYDIENYENNKVIKVIDSETFKILDTYYAVDGKNCYYSDYYSDKTYIMTNCDSKNLKPLSQYYAKDEDTAYYLGKEMDIKDIKTFRAKSGGQYAEDKYMFYNNGEMKKEKKLIYERVKGKIIIKTEDNGEAYYVHPLKNEIYFLGRPKDAFSVMREQGVGISEKDFSFFGDHLPDKLSGLILLRVEKNGEAYYVNPSDLKMYYLGRPVDALNVMSNFGLGISNDDFVDLE